jgi:hypothetical protein
MKCEDIIKDVEKTQEFDSICIGVARKLILPAGFEVEISKRIKDGWYNAVKVQDNCIVDVRNDDPAPVIPPPCSPVPAPCGGGGSGSVAISPDSGNLLTSKGNGLYAGVSMLAGTGVSVSGTGAPADPIIISFSGGGSGGSTNIVTPKGGGVESSKIGDIVSLTLEEVPDISGVYKGFEIDGYGRVVAFSEAEDDSTNYIAGEGIEFEEKGPTTTINMEYVLPSSIEVNAGGQTLELDRTGRVVSINPINNPNLRPGEYLARNIERVGVAADGTVTSLTLKETPSPIDGLPVSFTRVFTGTRDEDILNFGTDIPGDIAIEIFSSAITLASGTVPPVLSLSGLSVQINSTTLPVYIVANGHALVTSQAVYSAGAVEVMLRYPQEVKTPTLIRVSQGVIHEA